MAGTQFQQCVGSHVVPVYKEGNWKEYVEECEGKPHEPSRLALTLETKRQRVTVRAVPKPHLGAGVV